MTDLVWFRNDLRTADNPALTAATRSGAAVRACYLLTPGQWREHHWSPARVQLVVDHLNALGRALADLGIELHIIRADRFDDSIASLKKFCAQRAIRRVHFNEEYGVNERRRDKQLATDLGKTGVEVHKYRDQCAAPVGEILTGQGRPYSVFTPFARRWREWLQQHPPQIHPVPKPVAKPLPAPPPISSLEDWAPAPPALVATGETAAHQQLERFLDERVMDYKRDRDLPALEATSRISPYLANGVLSGRQCLVAALQLAHNAGDGGACWVNELAWRDFYIHVLYHFPRVSMNRAFKPETEALVWNRPGQAFEAWKAGQTGLPIVDAAMRQLNQTGWMHNRLRMVAAMYLTKNLFIDWRLGESYFMEQLADGFLASNNGGWQWSASTGTDAAPYFRVFNPVSQSERFDPEGRFIRRFVPELSGLDNKAIHQPWRSGSLPNGYPAPLVDLKDSRKEAIARFQALKEGM
ncbi:MAG: deoxyribodipyrimidine photo-lyase [Marinobacter sp.]|uniref:deoxyribodipyrimidine photo-lyase n=1 Tax=Marinobacter sp. TaxID=50741 RepID=UPI00299CF922|nr:deoxyribodipyrimidine photo-lyase [Marinobacter sp.]MDX1755907.1 deoxyribodipyrimidine photo-lyase [Marinobacter sp.]